ncbi:hypothetical protein NSB25_05735 [Acetatifactor muris]|uniref:Uncharacterized protein n=1 Tax=Acetatifactor muris TaxID=879566 RepID=A0A2K4ZD41_9FIRM|nr:hypothetical protein [Acetatifactor muris]MCR2046780.1 hypothetical protein [Acetatifactor muris]SOY28374.1 hypothetical protein AMURIS_01081 [Acetatifactor muris]
MKVVKRVRELRKQGFNKGETAGLAGINRATVEKSFVSDELSENTIYLYTFQSGNSPGSLSSVGGYREESL